MEQILATRKWLVFVLVTFAALMLGYLLAEPMAMRSIGMVGLFLGALAFPLLMRWHHPLTILCWNAVLVAPLPGQPRLWVVMAVGSLFISLLNRSIRRDVEFIHVPSVAWPLVVILAITAVTAGLTGGIGGRAFGSETWGIKRYIGVFGAVLGYFALIAKRVPAERAPLYASLFFLSGATAICSDIAYAAGPSFYFLFAVLPTETAGAQAFTEDTLMRLTGVSITGQFSCYFLLARYGIRGMLEPGRWWRLLLFTGFFVMGLLGGYRSAIVLLAVILLAQFYLEGLFSSRLFPILLAAFLVLGTFTVAFVDRLPLSVQRSLSFLPINVDPMARQDALGSLDWRLQMWKVVWPEVPNYLLLGKGYSFSGVDFYLTQEAMRRGHFQAFEDTLINGNYHQGVLTLIIPFGLAGFLAFLFFAAAGWRVLYLNYRHGVPALGRYNTFLLAFYAGRLLFYFTLYGQFDSDFMVFTGLIGLSIALNGGVRGPTAPPAGQLPSPAHARGH
jgi:hypothetical protein